MAREAHVLERREAVVLRVDAEREVATPFLFLFLFIWVYVQLLVGGACGGYIRIV